MFQKVIVYLFNVFSLRPELIRSNFDLYGSSFWSLPQRRSVFLFSFLCWSVGVAHAATPTISIDSTVLGYTENDPATQVDSAATLTDSSGDADWNGGTLVIQISANSETSDQISIVDNAVGTINTSGTNLLDGTTIIGTLSASEGLVTGSTALTITFNASATNALVQQVLRAIHFDNISDNPSTVDRTITITATDTNALSASGTRTVSVTAVNDSPSFGIFINDQFNDTNLDGWVETNTSGSSQTMTGTQLQLTPAANDSFGAMLYDSAIPSTKSMVLEFRYQMSGGSGADGLAFFLVDGATTVFGVGDVGGALGYADAADNAATNGLDGGWLGVGFDSWGNWARDFSAFPGDGPVTVETPYIGIRGSESTGYKWVIGKSETDMSSKSIDGGYRRAKITLGDSATNTITVDWDSDDDGVYDETNVVNIDLDNYSAEVAARPTTLKFGFSASTGGSNNLHAIDWFTLTTSASVGPAISFTEGDAATIVNSSSLSLTDADSSNIVSATVAITGNYQNGEESLGFTDTGTITGSWDAASGTLTLTGTDTVSNYQAALRTVTYFNGSDAPNTNDRTVSYSVTDASGGVSSPFTVSISVAGVNDAPTATNLSAAESMAEDSVLDLTDIVVSDVDSASVTATLTLSDLSAGTLSTDTSNTVTSSFSNGVWTASGALADVNTLLAGVSFIPAANYDQSFTIATSVDDGVAAAITGTKAVTVTAVNDAPTATNLSAAEAFSEDAAAFSLTDIVVSDVDSANITATLTLSDTSAGTLSTATSNGVTSSFTNGVWTASGALADVNTLLAGVSFIPAANYDQNFTIATSVSDGVAAAITGTKAVTVTAVNDAPTATNLSAAEAFSEDAAAFSLTDIVVSDVDSANITATLTLSDMTAGTLSTATSNTVTSSFTNGVWTASGALADVNTLLAGVSFTPAANYDQSFTIATSVDDGVAAAITGTKAVTVTAVNDAPTATNLSAAEAFSEDAAAFSLTGIVVSDVDSANITATLTLSDTSAGTLSTATSNGVTSSFTNGVWTASGALADVNTLLAGISFTPAANYDQSFTIATSVSDGVAAAITGTKAVTVTAVNDAPTATNLSAAEAFSEDAAAFSLTGIVVSDVDSTDITATLTLSDATAGTLSTATSNTVTSSFTNGVWTASGALADVNTLLAGVTFTPATNYDQSFTIATSVDDGVAAPITGTKAVTVTAVNDAPTATNLSAAEAFSEDAATFSLTDIVVSDVDSANITAKLTLSDTSAGTLSTATSNGVISSFTNGVWTASGALADVNTLLAGVTFTPVTNYDQSFTIATSVDDGVAAPITGTKNVTVTAVNDGPTGEVVINGNAVAHQTLTADTSTLADPDGLGPLSYQWRSGGVDVGSDSATYLLTTSDIGNTITVTVSYTDGQGGSESVTSAASGVVIAENNATGSITVTGDPLVGQRLVADASGLSDPDGLGTFSYQWYRDGVLIEGATDSTYLLTSSDYGATISVEITYTDGNGNVEVISQSLTSVVGGDNVEPIVIAPDDITVDATGLLTQVDLGSASASDNVDLNLTPSSDSDGYFQPGIHIVTWSVSDSSGNTGSATQTVNVVPLVNFSKSQTSVEGESASFKVILNGSAVSYPVTVPYTVSGTAATDGSDHDLVDGTITIDAPDTEKTVTVNLVSDAITEGTETLIITMGTPTNAVVGPIASHTIEIMEENVAPEVVLTADQGSGATRMVVIGGGSVVVTAAVTDPNSGDSHSYDWSATDNALVDIDSTAETFTFDASSLTAGSYAIVVEVSDGVDSGHADLLIKVVDAAPVLTAVDSDGDGINDDVEGYGDSDGDGVPDYLDNVNLSRNVVQEKASTADQYLMETEPGLVLSIGDVAFRAGIDKAGVSEQDITTFANDGSGTEADTGYANVGGMFDFLIDELPVPGQSVNIVIAQFEPIPADAVYRKHLSTGWQNFREDGANRLASAPGADGYCPPPGDSQYVDGLIEGYWCVQLTIEDGGPNDSDGLVNRAVADPGGVAQAPSQAVAVDINGGGGAVSYWFMALISLLMLARPAKGRLLGVVAVGLLLNVGAVNAEPSLAVLKPSYMGLSYLSVSSADREGEFQSDLADLGLTATVTQSNLSRSGWSPYIGYRLNEVVDLELGYVDLGDVSTTISGVATDVDAYISAASRLYPVTASGWTANFLFRQPVNEKIDLIYRLGFFRWEAGYTLSSATVTKSFDKSGTDGNYGLGIDVSMKFDLSLRLAWNQYQLLGAKSDAWEVGVGYRY